MIDKINEIIEWTNGLAVVVDRLRELNDVVRPTTASLSETSPTEHGGRRRTRKRRKRNRRRKTRRRRN